MVSSRTGVTFCSYEHTGTGRLHDVHWWFTVSYKLFWSNIHINGIMVVYIFSMIKVPIFYSKENTIKISSTFLGKKKKRYKHIGAKAGKYYSTQNSIHKPLLKSCSCIKQVGEVPQYKVTFCRVKLIFSNLKYMLHVFVFCSLVAKLCLTLCNTMDCSPPGSFVHGIFQARILEWVASSLSRGSSQPKGLKSILHYRPEWICYVRTAYIYSHIGNSFWSIM